MLTAREQKNASAVEEAPSVKPVASHITGRTLALGVSGSRNAASPPAWCFFGLHAAASGGIRGFGRGLDLGEGTSLLLFTGAQVIVGLRCPAPWSRGCRLLSHGVTDSLPHGQILLSVLRKTRGCCQENSVSSSSFSGSCGCLAHDSC